MKNTKPVKIAGTSSVFSKEGIIAENAVKFFVQNVPMISSTGYTSKERANKDSVMNVIGEPSTYYEN